MSNPPESPVDVDALVADIQHRAATRVAEGVYADATLRVPLEVPHQPTVALRPELLRSAKRGVGPAITRLKWTVARMLIHFLNDLVAQVNAALSSISARIDVEASARADLERRVRALEDHADGGGTNGR